MASRSDRRRPGARGFSDRNRIATLETPLGPDALLLDRMSGREAISQLFRYELDLVSEREDIDEHAILGQNVALTLRLQGQQDRQFTGFVSRFTQAGADARFVYYKAELVPWLWFLTRTANCRIFQQQTVPDILQKIFQEHGFSDLEMQLTRSYRQWEYCVQYRETDFNFVSRLMEQEGMYYYFEHSGGRHVMKIVDGPSGTPPCPGQPDADYASGEARRRSGEVNDWVVDHEVPPGKYALGDYNMKTPTLDLNVNTQTLDPVGGNTAFEIFDYPGEYIDRGEGDTAVKLRMQAEEAAATQVSARSDLASFCAGFRFALRNHFRTDFNTDYLLTEITHHIAQGIFDAGESNAYENTFTCLPFRIDYKPPQVTEKPVVHGVQTARVVGPASEEIHVDKYGRVRVHFFWDREHNPEPEDSSCWIRVAQFWAGKQWGAVFHPRVGQEVIVSFEEGDPDRPLIVGRVYNAENMPFYELPKYKTISTIKSNSSKGGKGFNEFRFEDNKGKEQVFIHSQKRMDVRVKGSFYETNGANRHSVIGYKDKDSDEQGGDYNITVGNDENLHINGGFYERTEKKLNETVVGDVVYDHSCNEANMIKAKYELNAREVVVEALSKISLKVGGSFVVIDLTGVTIQGPTVRINSGGAATPTGNPTIEDPLDATAADTGEPGYLEKMAAMGGGPARRRSRTLNSYHGPTPTRNADGSWQFNRGVRVDGTNQEYAAQVLGELAMINTTPTGSAMLSNLDASGRQTTIGPFPPTTPPNAFATPTNGTNAANGTGSDSTVQYNPGDWPSPAYRTNPPGDVILFHELTHAEHNAAGTNASGTPRTDGFTNDEEFNTIGPENQYRGERHPPHPPRRNHGDL
jgi:type VI secretion system secreted protein VgrG